jgi:hypothetical protein
MTMNWILGEILVSVSPHVEVKIIHMQNIVILWMCKSLDLNLIPENGPTNIHNCILLTADFNVYYNFYFIHSFIHSFIHHWFYNPLLGPGLFFSFVIIFAQTVGLLGRVISPSQGRYLYTGQHKQNKRTHRHPCLEWDNLLYLYISLKTSLFPAFRMYFYLYWDELENDCGVILCASDHLDGMIDENYENLEQDWRSPGRNLNTTSDLLNWKQDCFQLSAMYWTDICEHRIIWKHLRLRRTRVSRK